MSLPERLPHETILADAAEVWAAVVVLVLVLEGGDELPQADATNALITASVIAITLASRRLPRVTGGKSGGDTSRRQASRRSRGRCSGRDMCPAARGSLVHG